MATGEVIESTERGVIVVYTWADGYETREEWTHEELAGFRPGPPARGLQGFAKQVGRPYDGSERWMRDFIRLRIAEHEEGPSRAAFRGRERARPPEGTSAEGGSG